MDKDLCSLDSSWYSSILRLSKCFNLSRSFHNDMQNVYRIIWKREMQSCSGKLRTYSQFKKEFTLENYINHFPLHKRRNLTKLRISAHSLAIETGRYNNSANSSSNAAANKRLCFNCKIIESEFHFIFECNLYEQERKQMFEHLHEFTSIPSNATVENFCTLMSCLNGDPEVGSILCNFINNCFEIRRDSINIARERNVLLRPETTTTRSGRLSKRPIRLDV